MRLGATPELSVAVGSVQVEAAPADPVTVDGHPVMTGGSVSSVGSGASAPV